MLYYSYYIIDIFYRYIDTKRGLPHDGKRNLPATLRRLPTYLSYLKSLPADASVNISATAIAAGLNMGEVQVRKDLALISDGGRPKIGYNRERLIEDIEVYLGYDSTTMPY